MHNPADRSEPPESVRTEARHWTTDNLRRFLAHVESDRMSALYHLAAMTGLRRGRRSGYGGQTSTSRHKPSR